MSRAGRGGAAHVVGGRAVRHRERAARADRGDDRGGVAAVRARALGRVERDDLGAARDDFGDLALASP